jgi:cytochrome c oxidase cbb3-type subunit IV
MLKYIRHHLDTIQGIDIFPIISFVLFFGFFLGMLWWVFTSGKHAFDHMEQLPLNEKEN